MLTECLVNMDIKEELKRVILNDSLLTHVNKLANKLKKVAVHCPMKVEVLFTVFWWLQFKPKLENSFENSGEAKANYPNGRQLTSATAYD